jgi:hypothetical protein
MNNLTNLTCSKCKVVKSTDCFSKNKTKKSGFSSLCKECFKLTNTKWKEANLEIVKTKSSARSKAKYGELLTTNFKVCTSCNVNKDYSNYVAIDGNVNLANRRDICKSCESLKYQDQMITSKTKHCPSCDQTLDKSKFSSDSSRVDGLYGICHVCKSASDKKYKSTHPEKVKELNTKRMQTPQYKKAHDLRNKIITIIKGGTTRANYVGITCDEFRNWIAFQFDEHMNWTNHGIYWEIDHVVPCASFDLTNVVEANKCFNWTNLRPVVVNENNSKGSKILDEVIKSHKQLVIKYLKSLKKKNQNPEIIV